MYTYEVRITEIESYVSWLFSSTTRIIIHLITSLGLVMHHPLRHCSKDHGSEPHSNQRPQLSLMSMENSMQIAGEAGFPTA